VVVPSAKAAAMYWPVRLPASRVTCVRLLIFHHQHHKNGLLLHDGCKFIKPSKCVSNLLLPIYHHRVLEYNHNQNVPKAGPIMIEPLKLHLLF
jgi:hypothetical protein